MLGLYDHPGFTDVLMLVTKSFFVIEKDIYKLKVKWIRRNHGYVIAEEKLTISREKAKEFTRA